MLQNSIDEERWKMCEKMKFEFGVLKMVLSNLNLCVEMMVNENESLSLLLQVMYSHLHLAVRRPARILGGEVAS